MNEWPKPSSWSRTGEKIIDFKLVNKFAPLFDIRSSIAYKNIEQRFADCPDL